MKNVKSFPGVRNLESVEFGIWIEFAEDYFSLKVRMVQNELFCKTCSSSPESDNCAF